MENYAEIGTAVGTIALAFATFLTLWEMLKIETRRKRHELKKQIYLELLETLPESMKFWADVQFEMWDYECNNVSYKYQSALYKSKPCNCSEEVYDIIDKELTDERITKISEANQIHQIIWNKLIPALQKDLELEAEARSKWQFWK